MNRRHKDLRPSVEARLFSLRQFAIDVAIAAPIAAVITATLILWISP